MIRTPKNVSLLKEIAINPYFGMDKNVLNA